MVFEGKSSGSFGVGATPMTYSEWHHVAVVRAGPTVSLFLDGRLEGTDTHSGTINGETLGIGARPNNSQCLIGYIDEVRISKIARWTSEFVPGVDHGACGPAVLTGRNDKNEQEIKLGEFDAKAIRIKFQTEYTNDQGLWSVRVPNHGTYHGAPSGMCFIHDSSTVGGAAVWISGGGSHETCRYCAELFDSAGTVSWGKATGSGGSCTTKHCIYWNGNNGSFTIDSANSSRGARVYCFMGG